MPKTIIFCADGTWNGPDQDDDHDGLPDHTNVLKLFLNLAGQDTSEKYRLANEQERIVTDANGNITQIAKYLHGVGDSDNWLKKALGGGFGAGVISRIVRGYTFISRNHQPGDTIFLIGFSRGAYTVRALGGLIVNQGLLKAELIAETTKENAYCMGMEAWRMYRNESAQKANPLARMVESIASLVSSSGNAGLLGCLNHQLDDDDFETDVWIEGIGVWDTVGAMGVPVFHDGEQKDLFRFADTALSAQVLNGLHLVSIDERRGDFAPTLWEQRFNTDGQPDPNVKQILMPGAHADVGGGYPVKGNQSDLSDISLLCMTQWCARLGVQFAVTPPIVINTAAVHGVAHQPWQHPPFNIMPQKHRSFPNHLLLHPAVFARWGQNVIPEPGESAELYLPKKSLNNFLDATGVPDIVKQSPAC
ncbi:MAG: DUF2235 domain-containing protein [Magnetococcus sp. YQC-9]